MKHEITIDVKEVLETLGLDNVRETGREINYSCPSGVHRHGDHRPSAYCRSTYPYPYICFGCGQQGTIVDIVSDYLGIDRSKAWRWLGERFGFDTTYDPTESIAETLNRILGPKSKPVYKSLANPVIDPHGFVPLQSVAVANDYLIRRGLTQATINFFELQWDSRSGRIAIPIKDRVGNLIGFKARDITGNMIPKYMVLGDRKQYRDYGFDPYNSSTVLFGQNLISEASDTLIVVEGEFNCMRLRQAGVEHDVVGLPTAALSEYQSCIIREGYENVILYLDCDPAGLKGINTANRLLSGACVVTVVPDHTRDPMDSNDDEIHSLIKHAKNPLVTIINNIGE